MGPIGQSQSSRAYAESLLRGTRSLATPLLLASLFHRHVDPPAWHCGSSRRDSHPSCYNCRGSPSSSWPRRRLSAPIKGGGSPRPRMPHPKPTGDFRDITTESKIGNAIIGEAKPRHHRQCTPTLMPCPQQECWGINQTWGSTWSIRARGLNRAPRNHSPEMHTTVKPHSIKYRDFYTITIGENLLPWSAMLLAQCSSSSMSVSRTRSLQITHRSNSVAVGRGAPG